MTTASEVATLPIEPVNSLVNLMVRDVATVRQSKMPGEYDRSASQRFLSLTANVEGEDMGRASSQVAQAIEAAGKPPRGVRVITRSARSDGRDVRGAWHRAWPWGVRDPGAVDCLFQSPRLALVSIGSVPGVLSGVATILYFTGTTLNIESFMGSIMLPGVSVSNSVMLVTFMTDHWKGRQTRPRRPP